MEAKTLILFSLACPFALLTMADPQTNFLQEGCSYENATVPFVTNPQDTLRRLRTGLIPASFATSELGNISAHTYVLAQCRNYLSGADCLSCITAANFRLQSCSIAAGARVSLDGCFLRYEDHYFYRLALDGGSQGYCSNETVETSVPEGTRNAVKTLLQQLVEVTPQRHNFFMTRAIEVAGSGTVIFGVAQCVLTVSDIDCRRCLKMAGQIAVRCAVIGGARAVDAGCFLRFSTHPFFRSNHMTTDQNTTQEEGVSGTLRKKKKKNAILGVAVGSLLVLLLLLLLAVLHCRKAKTSETGDKVLDLPRARMFQYKELHAGTNNFCNENKLGEGGFGTVYKAILTNGQQVAVKKLKIPETIQDKQNHERKSKLLCNTHHRNLVRVLGFGRKSHNLMIVYEYVENGSLDRILFGDKSRTLNWNQRFDIILGTARGLAYLHEEMYACIVHSDIKTANILLDTRFQPKIGDWGLARVLTGDQSHISTKIGGTLGYTAPEYANTGRLSVKVDIYSFGIVILEIVSGRRCKHITVEPVTQYLLEWAWRLYENDLLMDLVDRNMDVSQENVENLQRVIKIGLMCTQSAPYRPAMSKVVTLLTSTESKFELIRPSFISEVAIMIQLSACTPISDANMTFSQFSGRS